MPMTRRFESELYWLAFLLTGRTAPGIDTVSAALEFGSGPDRCFQNWMHAWSRKVVIAKAVAAVQTDLTASRRRTKFLREESHADDLPPRGWSLASDADRLDLEQALLAIDIFPRCALLLTVFEKLSLADAATLLDADQDLVFKAKMIGLHELTRNLALNTGWQSTKAAPAVFTTERQHA
jgi:DNA-directed RNA polymerase specialized sigma24 family protein